MNDYYDGNGNNNGQRDLVLSNNEFCFVQSKSNGNIKVYTGPTVVTISAQETLVIFNSKTKRLRKLESSIRQSSYLLLHRRVGILY